MLTELRIRILGRAINNSPRYDTSEKTMNFFPHFPQQTTVVIPALNEAECIAAAVAHWCGSGGTCKAGWGIVSMVARLRLSQAAKAVELPAVKAVKSVETSR